MKGMISKTTQGAPFYLQWRPVVIAVITAAGYSRGMQ